MLGMIAWGFLVLGLFIPPAASAEMIDVLLKWDAPTHFDDDEGTPIDPDFLSHYKLYVCDAPILAGGALSDDPALEPAVCVGNLSIIQAQGNDTQARYDTGGETSGTLHFRVSAVSRHGIESRMSKELAYPFSLSRSRPPTGLRFVLTPEPIQTRMQR